LIRIRDAAKRTLDVSGAAVGIVLAAPLCAAVALAIRFTMGSPIFFRQTRPGLNGRPFRIAKFRTMAHRYGSEGRLLPDDQRLTPLGRCIRQFSIDELPQIFNVLKGDMSLVGPRPLLLEYLPRYSAVQSRRHEVKPGITGWAQVNGRNSVTWEEKFQLDVWYVDHQSFWLDLKILWITFVKVIRREGISKQGHATMPEFAGSQRE
jgi:lipopolysaccharide/colanic/teichoic acid biosynthesis glycosyltransferase